jgi:hypothetical protein
MPIFESRTTGMRNRSVQHPAPEDSLAQRRCHSKANIIITTYCDHPSHLMTEYCLVTGTTTAAGGDDIRER